MRLIYADCHVLQYKNMKPSVYSFSRTKKKLEHPVQREDIILLYAGRIALLISE